MCVYFLTHFQYERVSIALHSEITIQDGQVEQSNFDDYKVARIGDIPKLNVTALSSTENPTGIGEPGLPPVPPAIANAVTSLCGVRPVKLPIRIVKT